MSSKKITDLQIYTAAELSASGGQDLYFITDIANQETKAITALEGAKYANSINGITFDGINFLMSGSVSASSYTASVTGVGFLGTASWAESASIALTASYAQNAATVTAANNGLLTSVGIVQQGVGPSLLFKNLSGSSNISITDDISNNNIIISYTGVGGGASAGGPVNSIQYNYPAGVLNGDSNFLYIQSTPTVSSSLKINGFITASSINVTASSIGLIGTASWAQSSSNSLTSSYITGANVNGTVVSASYALSSSTATTASYALTANALTTYSSTTSQCFGVRYPLGNLTYGNYHYFNSYQHIGYTTLFRQNQNTNEVEKVYNNYLTRRMFGGHFALHNFNNNGTTEDCIVFGDSDGYINIIGNLSGTPTARSIYVSGDWHQYRCIYVDSSNPVNPTFYMAPDSNGSGTATNMYIYKVVYSSGYSVNLVTAFNLTSTLITNYMNFRSIITGPTDNFFILSQIYNPVKKRLYIVHNALGMCSIFNISSYGSNDIGAWWQQSDAVKLPQLSYEKTITIPQQGSNYWTYSDSESYGLEYDTSTGQENNWVWNRIGYDIGNGTVGKSPWFGI